MNLRTFAWAISALAASACGQHPSNSAPTTDSSGATSKQMTPTQVARKFAESGTGSLTTDGAALMAGAGSGVASFPKLSDIVSSASHKVGFPSADGSLGASFGADQSVDLSSFDTPPRDQGSRGWCTAFATVAAMENLGRQTGHALDLSEIHLWSLYQDYSLDEALSAARGAYLVSEDVWPYNASKPTSELGSNGIAEITDSTTIDGDISAVASALNAKHPVAFGVPVTTTFQDGFVNNSGVIDASGQIATDQNGQQLGHAIAIVGVQFDDKIPGGGYFKFKNSWGNIGDHGYGYLPFQYCMNFGCTAFEVKGLQVKGDKPVVSPTPTPTPSADVPVDANLVVALGAKADGDGAFPLFIASKAAASVALCSGSIADCASGDGSAAAASFGLPVAYQGDQVFRAATTFSPTDGAKYVLIEKDKAGNVTGQRVIQFQKI